MANGHDDALRCRHEPRARTRGGAAVLSALSVRRLRDAKSLLERASTKMTCRVTVSDRDFGVVHGAVALRPEDDMGEKSVSIGSLVRVAGKFGEDVEPSDGAPVMRASFYRHWPRYSLRHTGKRRSDAAIAGKLRIVSRAGIGYATGESYDSRLAASRDSASSEIGTTTR